MWYISNNAKYLNTPLLSWALSMSLKQKQLCFLIKVAKQFVNLICFMHNGNLNRPDGTWTVQMYHQTLLIMYLNMQTCSALPLDTLIVQNHDMTYTWTPGEVFFFYTSGNISWNDYFTFFICVRVCLLIPVCVFDSCYFCYFNNLFSPQGSSII